MQQLRYDFSAFERLAEKLEQAPQVILETKRQAFEAAALKMKRIVDQEIGGSGKVRSWQGQYVGSKGGYAAVRPQKETWAEATKRKGNYYAVGYVTNAINSGHVSPRARKPIAGKFFYQRAQGKAERVSREVASQIVQALTEHLEG